MRKYFACLRYNLQKQFASPTAWLVAILTVLLMDRHVAPVRQCALDFAATVSWPGLAAFLLDSSTITLLGGLAILALVIRIPMDDEAQWLVMLRSGRKTWARAQVGMVFAVCGIYLLLLALAALIWIAPCVETTRDWSKGILLFVEDGAYETYDSMLSYDPWIVEAYSPWGAALIGLFLHFLAYCFLGLLMALGNLLFGKRGGILLSAIPLGADVLMAEVYTGTAYYFSPLTLSRITCLDYGDLMGRPPVWYAFGLLLVLCAGTAWAVVRLCMKKETRI